MSDFHPKKLMVNSDIEFCIDNEGFALTDIPTIYLNDSINYSVSVVAANVAAYSNVYSNVVSFANSYSPVDISGYSYILGVDNSYSHGHTDLIKCTSVDASNASNGTITFQLYGPSYAPAIKAFLGNSSSITTTCCIWAYNSYEDNHILTQHPINICNSVGNVDFKIYSSSSESSSSSSSSESSESSEEYSSDSSQEYSSDSSSSSSEEYSSESSSSSSYDDEPIGLAEIGIVRIRQTR